MTELITGTDKHSNFLFVKCSYTHVTLGVVFFSLGNAIYKFSL